MLVSSWSGIVLKQGVHDFPRPKRRTAFEFVAWGDALSGCSEDSAMQTLLHRGDVSRGFSTESARATLLQGGAAFRASSTRSAGETSLQSNDASIHRVKKNR